MTLPWSQAWQQALYAAQTGFYRDAPGPAGHFTTASQGVLGQVLARAVLALARRHDVHHVVDVGCGRGELLSALHALEPELPLLGVDVVPRPAVLPEAIAWVTSPGGAQLPDDPILSSALARPCLVVANEWLDVVPCTVAEVDGAGVLREVLVGSSSGREHLGGPVSSADRAWAQRWWPTREPGARVEVGLSRDLAWRGLLGRMGRGVAVAIDYGHTRASRPHDGTLTAYRSGAQVTPVPDGSCDLTAHVAMDSLVHDELLTQREALDDLGAALPRPALDLARSDPARYLADLSTHSAAAALSGGVLGDFLWAVARTPRQE